MSLKGKCCVPPATELALPGQEKPHAVNSPVWPWQQAVPRLTFQCMKEVITFFFTFV